MKLLILVPFLAAQVMADSGWKIHWYAGDDCTAGGGGSSTYSFNPNQLITTPPCIAPGVPIDPAYLCTWTPDISNNHIPDEACTGPSIPPPRSFYLEFGTKCKIGTTSDCSKTRPVHSDITLPCTQLLTRSDSTFGKTHVNKCLNVGMEFAYWPGLEIPTWFECMQEDNP